MKLNPKALFLAGLAATGALLLASGSSTAIYEDQLLEVAVRQSFGDKAPQVAEEPLEIQALLLDYADNESLLLKARLALLRYPDLARRILPVYGSELEFQEVLLKYGEASLPLIGYFMDHDLTSLEIRRALSEWMEQVKFLYGSLGGSPEDVTLPPTASNSILTAEERGWYAIQFLLNDGYDLLGQFTITSDGKADWVQTERVLEGLSAFFLGGIRSLETKSRQEEEIAGSDWGWAALDVVVIAGSVKLLKAMRATRGVIPARATASTGGFSGRVAVFGSRVLARGGRLGVSIARLGAIPAAVYLMIRYPSLINATLAEFAVWLGIEPWVVQFMFWFVALWIILTLTKFLLGPLSWALRSLGWVAGTLAGWFRATQPQERIKPRTV